MNGTNFTERLSPLDLLMPGGYVGAALIFATPEPTSILLPKLQASLNQLCERIPWLNGRLFPVPENDEQPPSLEIRWSAKDRTPQIIDKGNLSASYDELSAEKMPLGCIPSDTWPAANTVQAQPEPGSEAPVFAASLFRFSDDKAVGLCVQAHHNTMDGFGFGEILKLWARFITDPEAQVSIAVSTSENERNERLSKSLAQASDGNAASLTLDELYERHPEYSRNPPQMPTEFAACTAEILTIPMKKIDALKENMKPFLDKTPTTNTVACALIWSAITRARMSRTQRLDDKTSRLPMAVNGRKRFDAALVDHENPYLGNVVLFSIVEMQARDVRDCGKDDAVQLLAEACRLVAQAQSAEKINASHVDECCQIIERLGDYRGIFPGWELFGSRDLFITSWADLNIYDLGFGTGLGQPQFVRIPYAQADGNVIVLPRKRNATNAASQVVEAVVMLESEALETLKKDDLWA